MNRKLPLFQKSDHTKISFKNPDRFDPQSRFLFLALVITIVFLVIFSRLFQLTIVKGAYYRFIAEGNRIQEIYIESPRGKIIDRKGFDIVTNEKLNDDKKKSWGRVYKLGQATAHLIGYRQLANEQDLNQDNCHNRLLLGDYIGKTGIEKIYDCLLRGKKGKKLVEVDALGKPRKILSQTDPVIGQTIQLAIDSQLQQTTYDFINTQTISNSGGIVDLSQKKVAVIAVKPKTGEVLIILSTPSFDPQAFESNNQEMITSYFADINHPMFNRVTEGTYPPGSVFKTIVSAGALENHDIDETTEIEDTGTIKAGPINFGNWYFLKYGKTEGQINVTKALQRSNDIYYYKIGEKMGWETIRKWAEKFGLGKNTGILLPEQVGVIPSDFWKKETIGERWFLGDTYNLSIGQGYLLTTPLQINMATAVFANGGYLCRPKLLKNEKPECRSLGISPKNIEIVKEGMRQACATGGTGWPFFDFGINPPDATSGATLLPIQVGCKTGTAESHLPSGIPHAWFTVMAPFDNPEIVLTVMVEEAGEGSNVAAPIAKEILKSYFERSE